MELIDFEKHDKLNNLRQKMSAPWINWEVPEWEKFNTKELLQKLNSIEGIEVNIDEIIKSNDGTFEYRGQKVLVYIRDQYARSQNFHGEYKYHIANCNTIERTFNAGRINRYVVSTRNDGRFLVNTKNFYTREETENNVIKELHVCKNCLNYLNYKNYVRVIRRSKYKIYNSFQLSEFFEKYGGSQRIRKPSYTDLTAPRDEYNQDFNTLSNHLKEKNGWCCEQCGRNFKEHKEFLHTHHKNGIKSDDSLENLAILCIGCHSKSPSHGHLKFNSDYKSFKEIFGE